MIATRVFIAAVFVFIFAGCTTYADTIRKADRDLARGENDNALASINRALGVKTASDLPKDFKKNRALLLLERATVLQGLGQHELSARDFIFADQYMAWLDVSNATADALVTYLYSAHSATYRAPSYERLMMNVLNMVNFLAVGNFQGAKVEARRFELLSSFYRLEQSVYRREVMALGHLLAGVAFEGARDETKAAYHYEKSWGYGYREPGFERRAVALIAATGARVDDATLKKIVKKNGKSGIKSYREQYGTALVTIVQMGLVPRKEAQYLPIITARRYAGYHGQITGINGINFPVLQTGFRGTSSVSVALDGTAKRYGTDFDIARAVEQGWAQYVPKMMTAAITRAVARAAVGATTRAATKDTKSEGWGMLLALILTGTLTAQDRPDTRSWTTLPAHIVVRFDSIEPGTHQLRAEVGGRTELKPVTIAPDRLHVVNFSRYR